MYYISSSIWHISKLQAREPLSLKLFWPLEVALELQNLGV